MSLNTDQLLRNALREKLKIADETTLEIVTAVAGLLASVAYVDRRITDDEVAHLKQQLKRLSGISQSGVDAIVELLCEHALQLSTRYVQRFTRTLYENLPESERLEVLDALLSMAATDGKIQNDEINSLRGIARGLGLSQSHYNELQARYRETLDFLPTLPV